MMCEGELKAIAQRFADHFGCPKSLRDLSYAPWVEQLKADAVALLAEVRRLRRES
jgi:hypothetical protein